MATNTELIRELHDMLITFIAEQKKYNDMADTARERVEQHALALVRIDGQIAMLQEAEIKRTKADERRQAAINTVVVGLVLTLLTQILQIIFQ